MATSVNALQQLMAPWLTGANPSSLDSSFAGYGGTSGLLAALMQGAGPQTSQARTGAALANAQHNALVNAQARQGLATGAFGLTRMQQSWPLILAAMRGLSGNGTTNAPSGTRDAGTVATGEGSAGGANAAATEGAPSSNATWIPGNATAATSTGAPLDASNAGVSAPTPRQQAPVSSAVDPTAQALRYARAGAVMGLGGFPGASGLTDYSKLLLANDPAAITERAVAGNPLAVDRSMMDQAARSHDVQGYLSAYTKMLTDANRLHISSMSGNVTGFGLPPWVVQSMTNYNPQTGKITANGQQSLIPGAAETEAALEAARAGAQESATLRASTAPSGGAAVPPTGAPGAASAPVQTPTLLAPAGYQGADAVRQSGFIPPVLSQSGQIPQRPGNTSLGQLQVFQKEQSERASTLAEQLNEQASSAQQLITQAQQIDAAARDFTPGKLANVKQELLTWGQQFGFLSPSDLKALGSAQEGDKLSIQLQATVTKQLGSREAAQVFAVMGKSIPNLTLSPDGLAKISGYLRGIAQYQIAQNTFAQRLAAQGNVAGVNSLPSNFQTYSNPVYYILANASPDAAKELIANMSASERAKVQEGWKRAISMGLAPAPGDTD